MDTDSQRFHGLDALRGGALLLGVFLHGASSFMPESTWMVKDSDLSWEILVGVFTVHIFRMCLFFTIAGFFANMLLQKRGVRQFIGNRSYRIALPLVVFLPVVLAGTFAVAMWAASYADSGPFAVQDGPTADPAEAPAAQAGQARPGGPISFVLFNVPLLHLWFLSVLLWFYAGALVLVGLFRVIDRKGRVTALIDSAIHVLGKSHLLAVALAVPLGAVFILHRPWTETGGIPAPEGGLIPNLQAIVGYGTAFGFGWFLYRQSGLLDIWRRTWAAYLGIAILLTIYCARVMGAAADDPSYLAAAGSRFPALAAYPLAIWTWCIALFGVVSRYLSQERKSIRYLADSSYWIYIVHLPIVGAAQVLVAPWTIGWQLKYPLVLILSIPVLLASYQWLVRDTWVGAWLNGRRYPKQEVQ